MEYEQSQVSRYGKMPVLWIKTSTCMYSLFVNKIHCCNSKWFHVRTWGREEKKERKTMTGSDINEKWVCGPVIMPVFRRLSPLLSSLSLSYSKTSLWWQHRTVRAQHGLPLAPDQDDLGPDFTSIAAASPLLAHCCTVQLTMPCLSAVVSSMQSRGIANLTKGWLTTAAR